MSTARCSLVGAWVVENARLTVFLDLFRFGFKVKVVGHWISRTETIGDLVFFLAVELSRLVEVQFSQIDDPRPRACGVKSFPFASIVPAPNEIR